MEKYTIQVESGRAGNNGEPSIGPVYRNALAKNGFPPIDPDKTTSWEVFSVAAEKYPGNRLLGWRKFTNGKAGPYLWKTCKEIYEEVLHVGSALQQLGAKPGSRIGIYGANCPLWTVVMEGMRCPANTHKPSFHVNTSLSSKHRSSAKGTSSSHRWQGMPTANINETMTEEEFFEWPQNAMQPGVFETNGSTSNDYLAGRSGSNSKSSSVKKKRIGKKQW